jgi:hemerythrin
MDEIKWIESYSVGVPPLDEQHKQLIEMINSIKREFDPGIMFDVIMRMFNYAANHFQTEEALMCKYSFSGLDRQIQAHKIFLTTATEFAGKDLSNPVNHNKIVTFLVGWLKHHILYEDMQYREILSPYEC